MTGAQIESPGKPFFWVLALSYSHTPWLPPDFVKGKSGDGPRGDLVFLADWCLGEITNALERLGIVENTLLIFTSNNGPHPGVEGHLSTGPLRGFKSHIWERGAPRPLYCPLARPNQARPYLGRARLFARYDGDFRHDRKHFFGPGETRTRKLRYLPCLTGQEKKNPNT